MTSKLAYFPSTFFGSVLGVSGLAITWRHAERVYDWPTLPGDIITIIGAAILFVAGPLYLLKCFRYWDAVRADFEHPVKGPFIAAAPLAILLQVPWIGEFHMGTAVAIYAIGAVFSLYMTIQSVSSWYFRTMPLEHYNAVWMIPGMGSFIVALTGAPLGFIEISWFFFSTGAVIWVGMSAVLMYRYMFLPPHPPALTPSYIVPMVPPGLMSMIYPLLQPGPVQSFTKVIYFFTLFLGMLSLFLLPKFLKLRFSMGWWAYTFPLDTLSAATILYAAATDNPYLLAAGQVILVGSTLLIGYIVIRTVMEIYAGRVLVPDQPSSG